MIQEAIQQNDAALAAKMCQASGIAPNLAAVAQMMSGGEIDDVARHLFEMAPRHKPTSWMLVGIPFQNWIWMIRLRDLFD